MTNIKINPTIANIDWFIINLYALLNLYSAQIYDADVIITTPKITRNELATKLDITSDGVKYNLKKLTLNNIIERIGPDNGGYWKIK